MNDRMRYEQVPLTPQERWEAWKANVQAALDEEPPTFRTVEVIVKPGEEGYENAPYELDYRFHADSYNSIKP